MERNIREFLREMGAQALEECSVLSPNRQYRYLLQGVNVTPLIGLMRERGVTKLTSHDGKWFLTATGTFSNPKSRESKIGLVEDLKFASNVFWRQNPSINPYFEPIPEFMARRYESSRIMPFARITFDPHVKGGKPCIRDMPVSVGEIVELIARGHSFEDVILIHSNLEGEDIKEALEYAAKQASQTETYLFRVEVEREEDGRWSAEVPALPGCNAWGYTREETLIAIKDTTEMYLDVCLEYGDQFSCDNDEIVRAMGYEIVSVTL